MAVDLADSRVLVLGGSGVLGSHLAAELDRRGARVALAGRDTDKLELVTSQLSNAVRPIAFDLRVPAHALHVVERAIHRLGGLDGLVNAAGVVAFGPLAALDDETLDDVVSVDFTGPLRVLRAALPHLSGGFVVNLTGVVSEAPVGNMAIYSAAKAGLSAATTAVAREARRDRIHFLDARPPHTETGLAQRPISGATPNLSRGLDPSLVAKMTIDALAAGRRELPAASFSAG